MAQCCVSANGADQPNTLEGRHLMEKNKDWKLTRRGWFVLVILPIILIVLMFSYATRDVCYVGQPDGNWLGYGSCSKMIDNVIEAGK